MRLVWLSLAAIPLMATASGITPLTRHALENDAGLKAEREALNQIFIQKEGTRIWDNPELSLSYARTRPDGLGNENEYALSLVQPVEKPSLRSAKARVLDARIAQTKALIETKERELSGEVRQRAYLYALAERMERSAHDTLALASTLREKGERRFEQGAISKADLLKLRIEEEKTAQNHQAALIKRDTAKASLLQSARLAPDAPLGTIDLPSPSAPAAARSIDDLPMIRYFKALEDESRAQQDVAGESVIPGFKAGIGVQQLFDQKSLAATLSMPIPLLHRNEIQIRNARSRIDETRLREQAYRFETVQKVQRQQQMLTSLAALSASQEKLIAQASTMVTMAQRSYEEGYGTLLELIDARRVQITHQNDLLNTLEMYYDTLGEMAKTFPTHEENL